MARGQPNGDHRLSWMDGLGEQVVAERKGADRVEHGGLAVQKARRTRNFREQDDFLWLPEAGKSSRGDLAVERAGESSGVILIYAILYN